MTKITVEDLKESIKVTEGFIETIARNKYFYGEEKSFKDVIDRIVDQTFSRVPDIWREQLPTETFTKIESMLKDGYFIPGGSILAGLKNDPTTKSSLSNCYVLAIEKDSIEGIVDCIKNACRTYSYRGGVGIDITILRPANAPVANAANTSSGAVSFMPMIAQANATIGTNGRRAAMMISLHVRHPDLLKFIWCKADPHSVFIRDHMSKDIGSRVLETYLKDNDIPENIINDLNSIVNRGRVPEINTANISVKITDEFMELVESESNEPWVCWFPDIEADKEFYNDNWDGDYDKWISLGGKIKEYTHVEMFITHENKDRFIGRSILVDGKDLTITEEWLNEQVSTMGSYVQVQMKYPSPKEILKELSMAAHMRGDPGILFWDAMLNNSTVYYLHEDLKPITTNPCSEIFLPKNDSCLLGAHVLSKYVNRPWAYGRDMEFEKYCDNCVNATIFMNMISDINQDLHPLSEQRKMNHETKRIGIEFTALADLLSMEFTPYGNLGTSTVEFLMAPKAFLEIVTSLKLAKLLGPCKYADPSWNKEGLERLIKSKYFNTVMKDGSNILLINGRTVNENFDLEGYNFMGQVGKDGYNITDEMSNLTKLITDGILKHGLRNTAFNTVGPTGTISIMNDNCSSGIEPIFALHQQRKTRVGDDTTYNLVHVPLAKHLLQVSEDTGVDSWDLDEIKQKYYINEASDINYNDRIAIQAAAQQYCDGSISSTVNFPEETTIDDVVDTYIKAWKSKLKGITIYVDGSLDGVLNKIVEKDTSTEEEVDLSTKDPSKLTRGEVRILPSHLKAWRYEEYWNGVSIYISVSVDEKNNPVEVFISNLPREVSIKDNIFDEKDYQEKLSLWMAITRLISVGLRGGINVAEYIKQLEKATFSINDLMAIVTRVLRRHVVDSTNIEEIKSMSVDDLEADSRSLVCPKCNQKTYVRVSGCIQCYNPECGHSTCS